MAISVILFGASFIGNIVGPSAVGVLNDMLAPGFGEVAVRYSMLLIAVTPMLAAFCFLRAASLYGGQLASNGQRPPRHLIGE